MLFVTSGHRPRLRSRPGQAIPVVAVMMLSLCATAALAIDLGMLHVARGEAQRGADAIALAAASAYIGTSPAMYTSQAKARAREYATRNFIRNMPIDTTTISDSPDIWEAQGLVVHVIKDSMKVRVTVRRRGIRLWFASLLGIDRGGVSAEAAAEAAEAGVSKCVIPFAIPVGVNQHIELGERMTLKSADSAIVSGVDPFFAPIQMPDDPNVADYCPRARGSDDPAWGRRNVCSDCDPGSGRFPGESNGGWHQNSPVDDWVDKVDNPRGSFFAGDGYAENICGDNCNPIVAGSRIPILTGDKDGSTAWGVNARLGFDPRVEWVDGAGGGHLERDGIQLTEFGETRRVVVVPTFDPEDPEFQKPNDRRPMITGFAYFFLEKGPQRGFYDPDDQLEIVGRFLYFAPGSAGGGGPYSRYLRLVE